MGHTFPTGKEPGANSQCHKNRSLTPRGHDSRARSRAAHTGDTCAAPTPAPGRLRPPRPAEAARSKPPPFKASPETRSSPIASCTTSRAKGLGSNSTALRARQPRLLPPRGSRGCQATRGRRRPRAEGEGAARPRHRSLLAPRRTGGGRLFPGQGPRGGPARPARAVSAAPRARGRPAPLPIPGVPRPPPAPAACPPPFCAQSLRHRYNSWPGAPGAAPDPHATARVCQPPAPLKAAVLPMPTD